MIDYALESLLLSGVQKTYVYCVSHSEMIRNYLRNSKWMSSALGMSVEVISQSPADCHSLGDSLRDLDGKALIRGDFILMSANVVSNAQLLPILEKHKYTLTCSHRNLFTDKYASLKGEEGCRQRAHHDPRVQADFPRSQVPLRGREHSSGLGSENRSHPSLPEDAGGPEGPVSTSKHNFCFGHSCLFV